MPITTDTDWFKPGPRQVLPHAHQEMQLLVEKAGLTPMGALVAATRNGAAALGILDERGTLEVGKAADLVLLGANPLEDIGNTTRILGIIKDGTMLEPPERAR